MKSSSHDKRERKQYNFTMNLYSLKNNLYIKHKEH